MKTADIFLKHVPTLRAYTWREWLTLIIALGSIVVSFCSIHHFALLNFLSRADFVGNPLNQVILIFWSCGPPAWFFAEYYLIWPDADDEKREKLRVGRELAKPFWAAVIATLLFLIPK